MVGTLHVHDLILLRRESALISTQGDPACPYLNPNQRPWVVVRRGRIADGLIPVGVRGSQRHERWAGFTGLSEVLETRRPDQLRLKLAEDSRGALQAFRSLSYLESHLVGLDISWGPVAMDLADNIAHGVRWHDATIVAEELGCNLFLEMPPGHTLTNLAEENVPGVTASVVPTDLFRHVLRLAAS